MVQVVVDFVVLDFLIDRPWKDKNWHEDELAQKK